MSCVLKFPLFSLKSECRYLSPSGQQIEQIMSPPHTSTICTQRSLPAEDRGYLHNCQKGKFQSIADVGFRL